MKGDIDVTERLWQEKVIQIASTAGWDAHHVRAGKYGNIYKTDGLAGMPDLILIGRKGQGIIFAELKTAKGKLMPVQEARIAQLLTNGCEVHIWRPADEQKVIDRLSRRLA
jgi:hypothetical protein